MLIDKPLFPYKDQFPAPSMSELWRELPDGTAIEKWELCRAHNDELELESKMYKNPCDALADLLIWVRKEAKT